LNDDRCIQIGVLSGGMFEKYESSSRIYSSDGISPTLNTCEGGHREVKILEEPCICASRGRNPENPSDRTAGADTEQRLEINEQGTSNTLTSVPKDNYVMEPDILTPKRNEYGKAIRKEYEKGNVLESRHNMADLVPKEEPVSNTLTSVQKDNYVIEPNVDVVCRVVPKSGKIHQNQEVFNPNGICGALKATHYKGPPKSIYSYRIRKLTPKECIRLMDFDDSDYDKIKAIGMSDSQIYKQCGNSIVVACLEGIFRKMFIDTEVENEQLSLF